MAFIGVGSRSGSLLNYKQDLRGKGAPFSLLVPKGGRVTPGLSEKHM